MATEYHRFEIDFSDLWWTWRESLTFEQFRDAIVARIGAAPWYNEQDKWLSTIYYVIQTSKDLKGLDAAMNDFYDYCDEYKIWVKMHGES